MADVLLSLKDLTVTVTENGVQKTLVDRVSLDVGKGSVVALVGGSGSGKTTTGLSVLRLLAPALQMTQGNIIFDGKDLTRISLDEMRRIRGKEIGMIFQDPLNAFNPVFSIGYQIEEVLQLHTDLDAGKRKVRIWELLNTVGINEPQRVAQSYPHQLSGGMRQRAMIAQAMAADPKLLIADEPTSSLDVTLQAHIIELFQELRKKTGITILLITHDLGVVEHLADQVAVMRQGSIVEFGATRMIIKEPRHPYTRDLMNAVKV